MKKLVLFMTCFLLASCGENNNNTPKKVQTQDSADSIMMDSEGTLKQNSKAPLKNNEALGSKYKELVDKNILTKTEARVYSDIELKYREKRIQYQNNNSWHGTDPVNISIRKEWMKNKKSEIISAIGTDKYDILLAFLNSKK